MRRPRCVPSPACPSSPPAPGCASGPGRTCEPLARLLDRAIVQAENVGLDPQLLVVAGGSAQAAEDIVRVRRKAHGIADWIHSPTCRVRIVLPAGLYATAGTHLPPEPEPPVPAAAPADVPAAPAGEHAIAVREALFDVIDPDLGVNIVDLGFVRAVTVQRRTAVITMTLTSAACPVTGVMEDQIRAGLAPLSGVDEVRIDWRWDAGLAARRHDRQRSRAAARHRLHHLAASAQGAGRAQRLASLPCSRCGTLDLAGAISRPAPATAAQPARRSPQRRRPWRRISP